MYEKPFQTLEELLADWNPTLNLGNNHWFGFVQWAPDRQLNPQYDGIPDVAKYGGFHIHPKPDGNGYCMGSITFESETANKIDAGRPKWKVESWEPLTLSPSLLCRSCNSHGFIQNGQWVDC